MRAARETGFRETHEPAVKLDPLDDSAWDNLVPRDKKEKQGGGRAHIEGETQEGDSRFPERTTLSSILQATITQAERVTPWPPQIFPLHSFQNLILSMIQQGATAGQRREKRSESR